MFWLIILAILFIWLAIIFPPLMKKWNNVMGVTYDNDFWKECVVTYTDTKTGEIETSPLRFMKDIK